MHNLFDDLLLRPETQKLVVNLIGVLPPLSPAEIKALGVDSAVHYRLLQQMLTGVYGNDELTRDDVDYERVVLRLRQIIVEIDKVLGDKTRLQALLQENVAAVYFRLYANTTWDNLFPNNQETAAEQ